ncbi:MAG: type I polyketide synthase [Iphinoe sp. HA4291-MV1]|jgi:acyl transferase domain-containing protein|nr:type I polyketide synthase [Iphinoe sp. HA4291-MV1]
MNREPIAIIGIGCRFPKAISPEAFWHLLLDGVDAITEMPASRWDLDLDREKLEKINTPWGGFLEQVDQFDPKFFGISSREAASMDPQQRLLLEVIWEALEDTGQIPKHLAGTQTGVFIGISNQDFSVLTWGNSSQDIYMTTGTSHSIAANRISYVFNFTGPSVAFDTACSSSLVAVHYACLSLWNQESTLAVAGGVNVLLLAKATANFALAGFLAPDDRCKTFDERADGYVRGEGAGVVILKPLSQALAQGDRIYAVIKGSAVNQDGRSNGLTAPNPQAQSAVLHSAYQLCGVSPGQVQYIEAHGTGTSLGDPIEIKALGKVLSQDRPPGNYCAVGSVKTNIGHLEAAAGIAGLIKVALSLKHRQIPPSLHFQKPNPYIPFDKLPLRVQQTLSPWPQGNGLALAGVSSFGFGGTNAHVVLAQAPQESQNASAPLSTSSKFKIQKENSIERQLHLLTLSAKSEDALLEMAQRYQEFLLNHPEVSLADVCFTANTGRTHFDYRLAVVAESRVQLQKELSAFTANQETTTVVSGQVKSKKRPKVAFLFTGQGSQYLGMGRQLYETAPIFRQTLDLCNEILRPYLEKSLLEVLYPESGETSLLNQTAYTQPALFAIEYALFKLWQSWGVVPTAVIGHSIGEYVAATVAGVLSLEDGLKLVAARSRLMQGLPPDGEMAVVFATPETIRDITVIDNETVAFAALNSPENTVISGERQAVLSICSALETEGIETKKLQVSHAFHSPLMEPMLAQFHQIAASITYAAPKIDLISNLTAQRLTQKDITPEYWCRHLRSCVRFADSLKTLHALGYETFVEIGPKPTLLGMGRNCLPEEVGVWLPSLRQGQDDWQLLLQSLGKLYTCGVPIDWSGFDRDYERELISLPTYPWQRQRYWIETSEQKYQLAESFSPENIQSPVTNLLDLGNTEELTRIVQKAGNFSPEQIKLLPELLSVLVREHKQHHVPDFIQDLCYEIVWREQGSIQQQSLGDDIPSPREIGVGAASRHENRLEPQAEQLASQHNKLYKETKTEPGNWLIFADNQGIGQQLSQLLRSPLAQAVPGLSQQQACILVFSGTEYKQIAEQEFSINPALPEDFQKLLLERVPCDKTPWRGVVYLWSLDTVSADALTVADLEVASQTGCGGVLSLVQSLISKEFSPPPTLWLVTKGAQRVGVESTLVGVAQSPVWGLGKVITNEHPEFNCTLVDLDPVRNNNAQSLFAEIYSHKSTSGETHIAFRNGQRYVNRLVRSDKIVNNQTIKKSLQLKADATYLITGGLSGIGLLVAKWMVEHGAKHLVLVGRSSPNSAAIETLKALEEIGTQVVVVQADVSQQEQVSSLLTQIKTSLPPLRGVIHAAGIYDARLLQEHQWEQFAKVFAPKVSGAWNLHTFTKDIPLDFFVLFSSAASIFSFSDSFSGLGSYAGANTFLDSLAHLRKLLGLPGLSINWGWWSNVGMTNTVDNRRGFAQLIAQGVEPIESQQMLDILEQLVQKDSPQVGVIHINWSKFLEQFQLGGYPALIAELVPKVQKLELSKQKAAQLPQILDQLNTASTEKRQSLLITYLQQQIAKAVGITTSELNIDEPLNQMGLDSLMVIELRNRLRAELGVDISVAKFLDGLSVLGLTKLVSEQIFEVNSTSKPFVAPTTTSSKNSRIRGEL